MTRTDMEGELQNLAARLAALEEEHAKTRYGWLWWLRNTGFMLLVFGISIFFGIWKAELHSQANVEANPIAVELLLIGIFLFVFGLWLIAFSLRPLVERMMKTAPRW